MNLKTPMTVLTTFLTLLPIAGRAEPPAVPAPLPAGAGAAASPAADAMPAKPTMLPNTSTWNLDADHSEVGFSVRHMMISDVRGSFHNVVSTVQWNDKDVTKSTIDVTITVASLDTRVQKRDDHLRSPDFLDATKFPTITFKSTQLKKKKGGLQITGDLTIHDVTKSITLQAKAPSKAIKDPYGLTRSSVSAEGKIKRSDFGLKWNAALDAGGVVVGDEVILNVMAEFVKKS